MGFNLGFCSFFLKKKFYFPGFEHYDDQPSILTSHGLDQKFLIYPLDIYNLHIYYQSINLTPVQPVNLNVQQITSEAYSDMEKIYGKKRNKRFLQKNIQTALTAKHTKHINELVYDLVKKYNSIRFTSQKIYSPLKKIIN